MILAIVQNYNLQASDAKIDITIESAAPKLVGIGSLHYIKFAKSGVVGFLYDASKAQKRDGAKKRQGKKETRGKKETQNGTVPKLSVRPGATNPSSSAIVLCFVMCVHSQNLAVNSR